MAGRYEVSTIFKAVDRFSQPIRRMQTKLMGFTTRARAAMEGANRAAAGFLRGLGRIARAASIAGVALGAAFGNIVRTGADFEQTLTAAATKFDGGIARGTEGFRRLQETAQEVGATTEFTAQQAAEGLNFLGQAGFNAADAMASLPGVAELATAAEIELGEAAEIATKTLGAFGLEAGQISRANDVLAATASSANTTISEMFEAIRTGASVAGGAGAEIEDFSAMVGALAEAGYNGSTAGTAIRNMFLRLQAPARSGQRAMRQLGLDIENSDGSMRDMIDILGDVQEGLQGFGQVEQARILNDLFGVRAVGPAIKLLDVGADRLAEYSGELARAAVRTDEHQGAAERMATQMRGTSLGAMRELNSSIEAIKLAIFDVVRGPLIHIVRGMIAWTRANREVIRTNVQSILQWFIDHSGDIRRWGTLVFRLVTAFTAVSVAIRIVHGALRALEILSMASPWTLLAFAIAGLIAILYHFRADIANFFLELRTRFAPQLEKLGEAFDTVGHFISETGRFMGTVMRPAFDAFKGTMATITDQSEQFMGHWETIRGTFETMAGLLTVALYPILVALDAMSLASGGVVGEWLPVGTFFREFFGTLSFLANDWVGTTITQFTTLAMMIPNLIGGALTWMENDTQGFVNTIMGAVSPLVGFFSRIWDAIRSAFDLKVGSIAEVLIDMMNIVQGIGQEALGEENTASLPPGFSTALPTPSGGENVVSPADRMARIVAETTNNARADITIRDQTGRAEVTRPPAAGSNTRVNVQNTGGL